MDKNTSFDPNISNSLEIAPASVVLQAVQDFAAVLSETPQFKAFEAAAWGLKHNPEAEKAKDAFLAKQDALKSQLMLNAVPPEDRVELERLRMEYFKLGSVSAYQEAEANLRELCQILAGHLSRQIGLDFAASSSSGCC